MKFTVMYKLVAAILVGNGVGGRMATAPHYIHQNMKFTAEIESDNKINFLDTTIHRTPTNWVISIHRKPTFTDTIIPYSSNHPAQHKYAAARFLYNRLHTYNLKDEEYKKEEDTILDILSNNCFPIHTHKPPSTKPQTTRHHTTQ